MLGRDDLKAKTRHMGLMIMAFVVQGILFLCGGWTVLFGIVCYLGGPDPRPGDLHLHLLFGTLWLAVGLVLIFVGRKAGRLARNYLKQVKGLPNQPPQDTACKFADPER
ncbi:phage holin family protein [Verrucomicrobiota bacterium]